MALRIEINRKEYSGKWALRIGDIEGCTEMSNVNFTEVLDEIHDRMKEIETNQYVEERDKEGSGE
jgi:hypothetical protein